MFLLRDAPKQFRFDHVNSSDQTKSCKTNVVVKVSSYMLQICISYQQRHLRPVEGLPVRPVACYDCGVKGWVDLLLSVMAAAATALLLALIARDDIGMPPHMIREDALVAASIMVAVVAAISWRKPKQRL
jgi:hypothetical protein